MPLRPSPPRPNAADQKLLRYVIPNLRNACRILKWLGHKPDGCKAADLARDLHIPVTTTMRIMVTLQLEGLVRKVESRFELGPVLISLGNASLAGTEIRDLALPLLATLTAQTDETSHLAIPCDDRSLIVAVQDSPHPLRAASRPGFLAELHCSSTGKVFLAYAPSRPLAEIFPRGAPRRTPRTKRTLAEIKREIELTRKRGYGLDDEEFHPGVRCLAAPITSSDGVVVAAIGITASVQRFSRERIPEIARLVRAAADELSRRLGHAR
ncbi:MAG: IclR family transcriptional regulator [Opitutae bacterium]|nr:IclR family transcriptional regulator [Opitutae bacterium]